MAMPAVVDSTGQSFGGATVPTPGLSGQTSGRTLFLVMSMDNGAAMSMTTTNGWTEIGQVGVGNTRIGVYYIRWGGSAASAPVFAAPASWWASWCHSVTNVHDTGDPFDVWGTATVSSATTTVAVALGTSTVNNCLVGVWTSNEIDDPNFQGDTTWTNASLTSLGFHGWSQTNNGTGGGFFGGRGEKVTAGSLGTMSSTYDAATRQAQIWVAIKEQQSGTISTTEADLDVSATISAAGASTATTSSQPAVSATISAVGASTATTSAQVEGTATVSAGGTGVIGGASTLDGSATLGAAGASRAATSTQLDVSATFAGQAAGTIETSATLAASAAVGAAGASTATTSSQPAVSATVSAAGASTHAASSQPSASATISAAGASTHAASSTLAVSATLAAAGEGAASEASSTMSCTATLVAVGSAIVPAGIRVTGTLVAGDTYSGALVAGDTYSGTLESV